MKWADIMIIPETVHSASPTNVHLDTFSLSILDYLEYAEQCQHFFTVLSALIVPLHCAQTILYTLTSGVVRIKMFCCKTIWI